MTPTTKKCRECKRTFAAGPKGMHFCSGTCYRTFYDRRTRKARASKWVRRKPIRGRD